MPGKVEFPFADGEALPTIPITLSYSDFSVSANALLDTGSTINLLPYDIGLKLSAVWEEQTIRLPLAGNLARVEARGIFMYIYLERHWFRRMGTFDETSLGQGFQEFGEKQ